MGLLSAGTPLDWNDTRVLADHVRSHGITQFLNLYQRIKARRGDSFLWGDEIEYIVCVLDHKNRNAKLSLRQEDILAVLDKASEAAAERQQKEGGSSTDTTLNRSAAADDVPFERKPAPDPAPTVSAALSPDDDGDVPTFHPEYGRYMLESTPGRPYGVSLRQLIRVEANMRKRRQIARSHLRADELPITLTSFPRLGVTDGPFTEPEYTPKGNASRSLFLPDELINLHPRFPTLTANIRKRRGAKVAINMPIFVDSKTPQPFIDPSIPWNRTTFPKEDAEAKEGAALENHIYMDAMGFGMGCCCLQVTFQACSIEEARSIYDALVPVGPIMLALTAASPAYRGYLADVDCRWNVISAAVDDRTPAERGLAELPTPEERARWEAANGGGGGGGCRMRMHKSRYDSVDSYLGTSDPAFRTEYNDNPLEVDEEIKARLMKPLAEGGGGLDESLASHVAHLFIRDPLVIFSERINQDDETSTDHFENIQSTNWQTMRFKPPPPGGHIGWRVEFRSMEVQITDFENAAFSVFIVLLTRAIQSFGLNFYMPISKVDENMKRAHVRDAIHTRKFYFRKQVFRGKSRHTPGLHSEARSEGDSPTGQLNDGGLADGTAQGLPSGAASPLLGPIEDEIAEYTLDELLNGKPSSRINATRRKDSTASIEIGAAGTASHDDHGEEDGDEDEEDDSFPGLIVLVNNYVDSLNVDLNTRLEISAYLDLLSARANGSLVTAATWIRNYVRSHPDYKFDSVVSQGINYDVSYMIVELDKIERGELDAAGFLPSSYAKRRREAERRFQRASKASQ
ncbi:glutamate--cysteine ligase [Tilletia horrida]|nr:glutamate--cysteine ligase [Tilletia horrida]